MDQNYLLNSVGGVEVILIPGSGSSVCVFEPETQTSAGSSQLLRATILDKELVFQPTGNNIISEDELLKVIRWYSYRKTFLK
ncbi:hypothetical protein [Mucilaginibacter rubeus]|uniref:hypothetical protein n=1 Tax=Mucilaginibacter rubeus TaxID=2027860 RepID=UPI0016658CB9|nr:hypothetical protein [Mucilaginibacter rubeus]GGB18506.1 hypothetical protein GCM10011500_38140 [Mucilaginibacter rubeus]